MRQFVMAALGIVFAASGARAADMPDYLRGSYSEGLNHSSANWDGWYGGGQVGYSSGSVDFSKSLMTPTKFMFRNTVLEAPVSEWELLNKSTTQGTGFGAFVGRNFQWSDLVFGIEANYKYLQNLATQSAASMTRSITNPEGEVRPEGHDHTYTVTLVGGATAHIKDMVTLRGRAGWAFDCFLPYAFGGLAVGRMEVGRYVTSSGTLADIYKVNDFPVVDYSKLPTLTQKEVRTNALVLGWTGGLGFEYMLWRGLFVRAEYEYVSFIDVKDTAIAINSVHAGIGYKF